MALIQPLQVPEHILQRYLGGTKQPELYEATYISSIRPNPHDMDEIALVQVTVRDWAVDSRELLDRLTANPQYATVGRDEHQLSVLCIVSIGPIAGNTGGGIAQDSMLVTAADRERELFSRN